MNSNQCANDPAFFTPKSRHAVLKTSIHGIKDLPAGVQVYRVAGDKFWRVRYFALGTYVNKTLGCTELEVAQIMAARIYAEYLSTPRPATRRNTNTTMPASDEVESGVLCELIAKLLEHEMARVSRDEIKYNSFLMTKARLEGFIFDYFSRVQLSLINADVMDDFVNYLTQLGLSGPTIKGYLAVCLKLLRFMHRKQVLQQIPLLPNVKAQYKPRGAFTITEYRAIVRRTRALTGQQFDDWEQGQRIWIKEAYQVMPAEMQLLIRFMVYTFVRPGDIRQMKHKHIEVVKNKFSYLRLTLPEVKRHQAPVVSMTPAVGLYERIRALGSNQGYGRPDDFVFFPMESDRKQALGVAGWLFSWVLNDLGLKSGPHGAQRSLYSLRHTAITFRLLYGGQVDLLTLAKNSRTSVEMIERFYASTLAAEANVSLLHAKRAY